MLSHPGEWLKRSNEEGGDPLYLGYGSRSNSQRGLVGCLRFFFFNLCGVGQHVETVLKATKVMRSTINYYSRPTNRRNTCSRLVFFFFRLMVGKRVSHPIVALIFSGLGLVLNFDVRRLTLLILRGRIFSCPTPSQPKAGHRKHPSILCVCTLCTAVDFLIFGWVAK